MPGSEKWLLAEGVKNALISGMKRQDGNSGCL